MPAYDRFYGTVPLPDDRKCTGVVRGKNDPGDYWTPGGFELAENDPFEIYDIDGTEPDESEYDKEYQVEGKTVTLSEFCTDWLIEHGAFEGWEPDYD